MFDARAAEAAERRGGAAPQTLSLRLSGSEAGIDAMLAALRGMADVDGMVELGLDAPQRRDDSSSAGLPDDASAEVRDVRVHVPNSIAYNHVHDRIEILAVHADVVVEWADGG